MAARPWRIGELAAQAGVTTKTVRHYESLGLLPKAVRTEANYRLYGEADLHTLRFIRRARSLGFGMGEIAMLLALWQDRRRASADVRRIAQTHVADLERRLAEMAAMKRALETLVACCEGGAAPECPILDELAQLPAAAPARD